MGEVEPVEKQVERLSAGYSANASAIRPCSFPALRSDSICASQTRASNSRNQARNFAKSADKNFTLLKFDPRHPQPRAR